MSLAKVGPPPGRRMTCQLLQQRARQLRCVIELRQRSAQYEALCKRLRAALNNPEPVEAADLIRELISDQLLD